MKTQMLLMVVVVLAFIPAVAQTNSGSGASGMQLETQIVNGPVAELVADSNATIGWSMHEGAGAMTVKYGIDRSQLNQTAEATPGSDGRNYHARLQGLKPDTRYYFQVEQKGETVGGVGTFHTVAVGAPPLRSKAIIPQ